MIDFQQVADCLAGIQQTGATSTKEMMLKRYGETVEGFKEVLKFIYDPYFTTGIKEAKLNNAYVSDTYHEVTVEEIMDYLRTCNTGTLQDCQYALEFIYQEDDPNWQWAAEGLVTKDLQIGVSVTTLNKVYGKSFIPKIGIMRGMLCPEHWTGYGIATEKIDGNRRLFFNTKNGVKTYTRSGKPDTGLTEIEAEISSHLPKGYVFDCECVAEGSFGDNIELRQASASILNRRNQQRRGVRALCFDVIPIDEYNDGQSRLNALARKTVLAAMMGDTESILRLQNFATVLDIENSNKGRPTHLAQAIHALSGQHLNVIHKFEHIRPLPILGVAASYKDGVELAKPIWDVGGEGVMLVEWQSPYEVNPNPRKTLLKIKMLKEYEATCIGVFEGDNKYAGTAGGLVVNYKATDGKNYHVKVGTGFTDWDRDYLWHHADEVVGRVVELDSFGESVNAQGGRSLNCPVFKRFKGDTTNE